MTSSTATSVAPTSIKADSAQVTVFGIDLRTDAGDTLTGAKVKLNNVVGFTTADLAGKSGATSSQGVQLWRDSSTAGANQDVLDAGDTAVSTGWSEDGDCALVPTCTATFTMAATAIPGSTEGSYTFLIAVRTSNTIADGNTFTVEVSADSFTTSPSPTLTPAATTPSIIADTVAPAAPTVSALGLSKAAGKARVGGTAVSAENPGTLEVHRDDDAGCASPTYVTDSGSINLTQTNTDLVGTNASQTTALQGIPTATETLCYLVRDAAGNLSPYSPDGLVPAAPSSADVALLGSSNVTNLKRVTAQVDASPGRTFRVYLRPGGSGLERAKDENLVTPTFVQVTTGSSVAESGTTDIRQFENGNTLAAGDGIAYARVNANGNSGPVTDDGTVPAVPTSDDLGLLSTSAVEGHQRVVAEPDATPGRIFGLYLDPAGLTTWEPAVTTSGGTTPVRVTTASGSAASATTTVFAGPNALAAGFATGLVRVDGNGNESAVGSNGSIPAVPVAADIKFSDALNNFVVDPFPAGAPPLAVQIGLYAGSTPSGAYDGTPEGVATSATPASVGELAAGQNLYYSAVNTTTGNESPLTADGSIPAAPDGSDIGLLWTSAAEGHRRVVADADPSQPRTFRLYLDAAGGSAWVRATTLADGTIPVEVTTSNAETDSGTATVFAGATALSSGHAVGYSVVSAGNDSDATADGLIPAGPLAATTSVSDALNQFTATAATASRNVNLHYNGVGDPAATAYDEAGPKATASSSLAVSIAELATGTTLFYTVTDTANGNESQTVDDGDVPGAPTGDLTLLGVSAATGHQRMTATTDTVSRTFRLYLDPAGGAAWTRASTSSGGSTPVEITTSTGAPSASPTTTIFSGATQLDGGAAVGYALRSAAGNDSDVAADGAIPAAPPVGTTSATAAIDDVTATTATATNNVHVYKSTSADPAVAYDGSADVVLDADTTKDLDTSAGDRLYYTMFDTATNNESPTSVDGAIPVAPSGPGSSASAATDSFVVPDASATNNVRIFLDASATPATAYANGVDYTATSSPWQGTNLPSNQYVHLTSLDTASGNESAITTDGSIPAPPGGADSVMSASAAEFRISSSSDSTGRTLRLHGDPAGGTAYVKATTTSGGSTPVEIETLTTGPVTSAAGIYLDGSPLAAGASIAYTRILEGNESDYLADGTIPSAPVGVANFSADAADQTATVAAAAAGGTYRVFRGTTTASSRTAHSSGTPTTITTTGVIAGDAIGYAVTSGGNESPVLADGTIPIAPGIALQTSSDTGRSNVDALTSNTTPAFDITSLSGAAVTLYEGSTTHSSGTADSNGDIQLSATALSDGAHTIKAKTTVGGNTSPGSGPVTVTVDTAAPATPGAPDLVAGSDSGSSQTDNITNDTTPTFDVVVEADADALLFNGATQVASGLADGAGAASLTSPAVADATHAFGLKATDAAGNTSALSPTLNVTVDTVAPGSSPAGVLQTASDTGRSATDSITGDNTPSLDVTGADAGASLVLREGNTTLASAAADGSGNATLTSSVLPDGSHDLTVSATDVAGNLSPASSPTSVTIDTAAPAAPAAPTLTTDTGRSALDNITADSTPAFTVATEGLADVELVEGATVLGSAVADSQGASAPVVGSALADGSHSIAARATDVAGNVSLASSAVSVTIDTTAPAAPGTAPDLVAASDTGSSATDDITNDNTPTFDVVVEADADAELFAGQTSVGTALADGAGNATPTAATLADATHSIGVKAVDAAGNVSALSPTLQVTIDTVAPTDAPVAVLQAASDTGRSAADGITSDTAPVFDVTGADAGASLKLHDGGVQVASGTADSNGNATLMTDPLGDGSHDIVVSSVDVAGNASAAGTPVTVVVDTQAPEAPAVPSLATDTGRSLTDNITKATTPAFTVATEPLASVEIVKDGTSLGSAIADGAGTASPAVAQSASLADGAHSVTARATDAAGNVSAESSSRTFTVDATPPAAPASIDLLAGSDTGSSDADDLTADATPSFSVVFAEANGLVMLYAGGIAQADTPAGDASLAVTADTLADGVHQMTATVSDVAGNESTATAALPVTIDTIAPATPAAPDLDTASDTGSSGVDDVTGDTTPTFNLAGGEAGSTLTLMEASTILGTGTVNGSGDGSVTSSALADGLHSVSWKATDGAGNASALSQALSVRIDTGVPSVVLTTTSALTGTFKAVFSEDVSPVNSANVVLRVSGTTTNVPASVTYNAGTRTATLKPASPMVAGQLYQLIVGPPGATKPTDSAGGQVAETAASVRASTVEQENSAGGKSQWGVIANSAAYGGSYTAARLSGATASFSFTGTAVTWYTLLAPDQGKARVLVDGIVKGEFDNYRSAAWAKFPRSISGLSNGPHTVTVVVLGTKSASARNTYVAVDAFKVGSTLYEHWNIANQWQAVGAGAASGGRYVRSDVATASHYFTFRGTGVDWMTMYGPNMGKASVYIDGVFKGTFDNWSSSYRYAQVRSFRGLSNSVHTIRIVALGQKRSGATGTFVVVDRFNVV